MGVNVTNVDPFLQYGPKDVYIENPVEKHKKLTRALQSQSELKRCCIQDASLAKDDAHAKNIATVSGSAAVCGRAAVISCTSLSRSQVSESCTW